MAGSDHKTSAPYEGSSGSPKGTSPGASERDPSGIAEFLGKTLPFTDLPEETRLRLAKQCTIDFIPRGEQFMHQGKTEPDTLWLVQRGGVRLFLDRLEGGEESLSLVDFRGEGGAVGALALIRGDKAGLNAETVEDTFFIRMEKQAFLELVDKQPGIARHYLKNFSETYMDKAFSELRQSHISPKPEASLYLFTARVDRIVRREPIIVEAGKNIRAAAEIMAREHVGSLLVADAKGEVQGIVTDKDFRYKVVAQGLNYNWPLHEIMTAPVATIRADATCFDALLTMMREKIHHLAVVDPDSPDPNEKKTIRGVITSHDILVLQGRSPFSLYREIVAANTFQSLYDLSRKTPMVIRLLMEEGARADNVSRMVAVLGDLLLERLLTLCIREAGTPPVPFSWILLGSEGRREQTFRTDQDNALAFVPPGKSDKPEERKEAEAYFAALSRTMINHLEQCGFPRCPGDMMASNPQWRKSGPDWRTYFLKLMQQPEPDRLLHATIFFDLRHGYGDPQLCGDLRALIADHAPQNGVFLKLLARDCLRQNPPLTFFKNFMVEKDGQHKNRLDLKKRGIMPFVDFARLLALSQGVQRSNTLDRLKAVYEKGALSHGLYNEIREAYAFITQIRMVHQLRRMDQGREPDNFLDPSGLTELEKRTLKQAFAVLGEMQSHVRETFRLDM
ncbi:MAG: putative nucleotidyltransferase substrate binding domain-containing protein [Desulfovibrio sp.]|uniref:putative nucleotidyltransferase substrate binding domain-containing protein n=1 Tax=Desulfovibrio sp. 7SRBS1 TaxID=3378064 RepID=UPI003B3FF01C